MAINRYLRVECKRLFLCEEHVEPEVDGNTGMTVEGLVDYVEIEVTADLHEQLLVHYAALGKRPKLSVAKPAGGAITGFEDCWAVYPRRDAKAAARKAWQAQRCDQHIEVIRADIARRSTSEAWSDAKFVPYMATYLNQRRWEDEPEDDGLTEEWL